MGDVLTIRHVIGTIDLLAAGPTYTTLHLARALAAGGASVEVLSTGKPRDCTEDGVRLRVLPNQFATVPGLSKLYRSSALDKALADIARGDVVHVQGLWSMPTVYPARHARRKGAVIVQSPHGMLTERALSYSSLRKKAFSALAQRRALEQVTCFHATSREEVDDIRNFGLTAPVALVPNGVEVPPLLPRFSNAGRRNRTLLYFGRLHRIKGLDRLLDAWPRLESKHARWDLRIVGPSHGTVRDELMAQARALGLQRVHFEDAIFGEEKFSALQGADLLVLPTLSENFAMVVPEALACGTPVVCTKGAPWPGLQSHSCGWWIDHGVDALAAALDEAMSLPEQQLEIMGRRGREWMLRDFSWDHIAAIMLDVYRWCVGKGDRPACVASTIRSDTDNDL